MAFFRRIRRFLSGRGWVWRTALILAASYVLVVLALMWWWSYEPESFDVRERAGRVVPSAEPVTGAVTTATLINVAQTLLDKPGGYFSNDIAPPGLIMDNMPSWEYGALVQVRDLARSLRNDFSRSQTQSTEDKDLSEADPQFHFDATSWMLPATESEYRKGISALERYLVRLSDPGQPDAQFYSRADNLVSWLYLVELRLGSLSQRLAASVGERRINTDLAGEASARQSTATSEAQVVRTPWLEIDDVFYEARGATWALLHFLKAVEVDFRPVLEDKNALVSLRQIISELESALHPLGSPIVLNGSPYGFVANHSLVMSSYLARANAAVIDLRSLLTRG